MAHAALGKVAVAEVEVALLSKMVLSLHFSPCLRRSVPCLE